MRIKRNWFDKTSGKRPKKVAGTCSLPSFSTSVLLLKFMKWRKPFRQEGGITASEWWGREIKGTRVPEDHEVTTPALGFSPLDDLRESEAHFYLV